MKVTQKTKHGTTVQSSNPILRCMSKESEIHLLRKHPILRIIAELFNIPGSGTTYCLSTDDWIKKM